MAEQPTKQKLWGGRFTGKTDPLMHDFNQSLQYDQRMHASDIKGSIAYAKGLRRVGILNEDEERKIIGGLQAVGKEWEDGVFKVQPEDEDIHTVNERRLSELIGPLGGKLHTGRSRNNQVATDMRLWLLEEIKEVRSGLMGLIRVLVERADKEKANAGREHLDSLLAPRPLRRRWVKVKQKKKKTLEYMRDTPHAGKRHLDLLLAPRPLRRTARTKGRGRRGGKAGVVKQTAQKSTGAPAPRVPLGISTVKASPAPKSANKGGKKPIPAKRDIKLKAPQPKIKMHGAAIQHLSGAMGFGVLITTKMGVELYTEQQFLENNENPPVRLLHCITCNHGGKLIDCDHCMGAVCCQCLPDAIVQRLDEGAPLGYFMCPRCHAQEYPTKPYKGFDLLKETLFLQRGSTYRTRTVDPIMGATLILFIYLKDPVVKPGVVLGAIHPLKIWAADDLVYCAVPFDFKDDTSDYLEAMNDVVNQLQDGVLQRVKKIVVVVSTHTDPERGDFHIIPDCGGSVPFDELANVLFPEDLRVQLRARGFWSQLVLLACGSFWRMREPVTQIFDFVKDIGFDHALGFSAQNLQTALTTAFVQHALENFVIHEDRSNYYTHPSRALPHWFPQWNRFVEPFHQGNPRVSMASPTHEPIWGP
ncbi:argininosuccinate lyase [Marasmius tenuissimus]|uniref:Argininosuccinate lyase n=1 Tax=Marasmius tenuissimus TaxID=585030 RepID=A0ABR2ZML2_9AGAR